MQQTFAFNNYFNDCERTYTITEQWDIVQELGFDKAYYSINRNDEDSWKALISLREQRQRTGLGVAAVYTIVDLTNPAPEGTHAVEEMLEYMDHGDTLELVFSYGWQTHCSDPEYDGPAVEFLRALLPKVEAKEITISLYHHFGFHTERIEDCIRLAQKVDHPSLKVTFCGFHWFAIDGEDLADKVELAKPYLHLANICGSDSLKEGEDGPLPKSILPVGEGTFPLEDMLKFLKAAGYEGPIGFQGYSIGGDAEANLKKSIKAYQAALRKLS